MSANSLQIIKLGLWHIQYTPYIKKMKVFKN